MHYIVTILAILAVGYYQIKFYLSTKDKISTFANIFPDQDNHYALKTEEREKLIRTINDAGEFTLKNMLENYGFITEDYFVDKESVIDGAIKAFNVPRARQDLIERMVDSTIEGISHNHKNKVLDTVVSSINSYLENNKTVSDFHLMKDMVDRNCDALEEEISLQIPNPQYLGLGGTMLGILLGILTLWFTGGVKGLLNLNSAGDGVAGIEGLLGGVGLAMISSILGILLTTISSTSFKNAKAKVERNKHTFLSWIQVNLLPTLSDNAVGAIQQLGTKLEFFNSQFEDNTSNLALALGKVNESYKLQVELIQAVNQIKEEKTVTANLKLFNKLTESSEQIGQLAEYLSQTTEYLEHVQSLNENLELQSERTKVIEDVGVFFKQEVNEIESRKSQIALSVGKVDDYLRQSIENLKESTEKQLVELEKVSVKNHNVLLEKSYEVEKIIQQLEQLPSIMESASRFEKTVTKQNASIDRLAERIEQLAETKASGNIEVSFPKQERSILNIILAVILGLIAISTIWLAVSPFFFKH